MNERKTVLVAALNWGIGHATRDIPIIDRLLERDCEVILASDGAALDVWRRTYPQLESIELPSWNIKYQKKGSFMWKMATRAPYILKAIEDEKLQVKNIIEKHSIDGLISDNRFGVYSPEIPSIFITHQISLRLNRFLRWAEPLLDYYNHHYIKKFDEVWVPDFEQEPNLSGELSHKHRINDKVKFIGPISRFMDIWDGKQPDSEFDIAVVLSGVEPQRSMLEEKLIRELKEMKDLKVILVQGKSNLNKNYEVRENFRVQSFMDSEELLQTFLKSKYIICRSGYSTILDLAVLKQTALMIPTPGQTEQEYLGKWMNDSGLIVSQNQQKIDLPKAMLQLENTKGFDFEINDYQLQETIDRFLETL